jgi:RNA polymerase sigma factor (sigma-70 family)
MPTPTELFKDNLDLAELVANEYRHCGVASYLELITVAQENLWEISGRDSSSVVSFRSFARKNIRGAILRYIHWCCYGGTQAKYDGESVVHHPIIWGYDEHDADDLHCQVIPELPSEEPSPFDIVSSREQLRFAIAAIDELPKRKREALIASLSCEGFDKLAPELGMTRKGMSSMVSKARAEVVAKASQRY